MRKYREMSKQIEKIGIKLWMQENRDELERISIIMNKTFQEVKLKAEQVLRSFAQQIDLDKFMKKHKRRQRYIRRMNRIRANKGLKKLRL